MTTSKPRSRAKEPSRKTWTVAEVEARLQSGEPLDPNDYVVGEGGAQEVHEDGTLGPFEPGGFCTTVEFYLATRMGEPKGRA
jgi:hypothetical protein